jgi:hypothetical protein
MYSHTLLPAILPPFLCTADISKITITLFVKKDDILTTWTHRLCVCMWYVCLGSILIFLSLNLVLLSPCTFEQWLAYHWWYVNQSLRKFVLDYTAQHSRRQLSSCCFFCLCRSMVTYTAIFVVPRKTNIQFRFVFWDVVPRKIIFDDVSEVHAAWWIIALRMEAACTSETSVDNYITCSTPQKTNLNFILAAVRTWNLTQQTFSH